MILVITGAFDLYGLAIEKEPLVGIEGNVAHAEIDTLRVTSLASRFNRNDGGVEIGRLGRPKRRRG
jgi:hypothetical protein